MRYKFLTCEILYREVCAVAARAKHTIDLEFLPKRLHDIGQVRMFEKLVEAYHQVEESHYDAVLLGYGLCNNGVVGLQSRSIPLVIPRAHDCITLLLGNKEKYAGYFHAHPGTYYLSSGWIERGSEWQQDEFFIQTQCGTSMDYAELVKKYGEENAKYLHQELGDMTRNYSQITYIDMGFDPGGQFQHIAKSEAEKRGWAFDTMQGDLSLLQRLVDGEWDETEFLVIPPNHKIVAKYDEGILAKEACNE